MASLVIEEVIINTGKFTGLRCKVFDNPDSRPGPDACLLDGPSKLIKLLTLFLRRPSCRSVIAGSNSLSRLANVRSVGISPRPGKSPSTFKEKGSTVHVARKVNSSRAARHWPAKARAHHAAWLSGSSKLWTTSRADAASLVKTLPCSLERIRPGSAQRRQIVLHLNEPGWDSFSGNVHENPQCIEEPVKYL